MDQLTLMTVIAVVLGCFMVTMVVFIHALYLRLVRLEEIVRWHLPPNDHDRDPWWHQKERG